MSANWELFKTNVKNKMLSYSIKNNDELSELFSSEYDNAVKSATTVLLNTITSGTNKNDLKLAFKSCFDEIYNSKEDLKEKPYEKIGIGLVSYWKNVTFNPIPVHLPANTPTTGITVLVPSLSKPVDVAIYKSFQLGYKIFDANLAIQTLVESLVIAFSTHLLTISGVYNGNFVSPTGVITIIPPITWSGLI